MRSAWATPRTVVLGLAVFGCETHVGPEATHAGSESTARDDPAQCVDGPASYRPSDDGATDAFMKGIAGLSVCAQSLARPGNVLARLRFRADGTAQDVEIVRTSIAECGALDCVRDHLAKVKAPPGAEDRPGIQADFELRKSPAPDGNERIKWDSAADSDQCTDEKGAVDRIPQNRFRRASVPISRSFAPATKWASDATKVCEGVSFSSSSSTPRAR
jgi:hypothetical protein